MRVIYTLVALAALTPEAVADPVVTRGFELLKANCSRCHSIGTDGDSPHQVSFSDEILSC
jgi:mono/diheme cytochrome c family protein